MESIERTPSRSVLQPNDSKTHHDALDAQKERIPIGGAQPAVSLGQSHRRLEPRHIHLLAIGDFLLLSRLGV